MCGPKLQRCREVGSKTRSGSAGAVWVFGSGYGFMFLRSGLSVLRLMERRVGGGRERSRKHCHGDPQPLTGAKLVLLSVSLCVSLVLPCLARRQDVGVMVGGDLQAPASRLCGGPASRKCYVITPGQLLQVDRCGGSPSLVQEDKLWAEM